MRLRGAISAAALFACDASSSVFRVDRRAQLLHAELADLDLDEQPSRTWQDTERELMQRKRLVGQPRKAEGNGRNVLLIYMDDLRLNLRGIEKTPGQDRLRKMGHVFKSAYCSSALCAPSRTSTLSGRRPEGTHVWFSQDIRSWDPDVVTLPQRFKEAGYETYSVGKVFHGGPEVKTGSLSWTYHADAPFKVPLTHMWRALDSTDYPELETDILPDGIVASLANKTLHKLASGDKPWFLAVGFRKPHLPWIFPKRFWKQATYLDELDVPPNPHLPKDAPELAAYNYYLTFSHINNSRKMCANLGGEDACKPGGAVLDEAWARDMRRAYHASALWAETLVQRLLWKVDELELWKNTVVVYISDHGWKLGDLGGWGKETLYQVDLKTPFIISAPGLRPIGGKDITSLVEHIDLAPTLAELCGLQPDPSWDGTSLLPLLKGKVEETKDAVFATQRRGRQTGEYLGSSITTRRYSYIEWPKLRKPSGERCYERLWDKSEGAELYDLESDPHQKVNVVNNPGYASVVLDLSAKLREQYSSIPCELPYVASNRSMDKIRASMDAKFTLNHADKAVGGHTWWRKKHGRTLLKQHNVKFSLWDLIWTIHNKTKLKTTSVRDAGHNHVNANKAHEVNARAAVQNLLHNEENPAQWVLT